MVTHDVGIQNHARRISADNKDKQRNPEHAINHKNFSYTATLNIRTIRLHRQQLDLANRKRRLVRSCPRPR